jgi:hypothetical protein
MDSTFIVVQKRPVIPDSVIADHFAVPDPQLPIIGEAPGNHIQSGVSRAIDGDNTASTICESTLTGNAVSPTPAADPIVSSPLLVTVPRLFNVELAVNGEV